MTIEEFWQKVDKTPGHGPAGDCWLWRGAKSVHGYGYLETPDRPRCPVRAHRFSYQTAIGPIAQGLCVCHRCDVKLCVNPSHLFLGTHTDNHRDMCRKGRNAKGDRHGSHLWPELRAQGEKHWTRKKPERIARGDRHWSRLHPEQIVRGSQVKSAKLTEALVVEIRLAHAAGVEQEQLAQQYGVSRAAIGYCVRRITWRHVD